MRSHQAGDTACLQALCGSMCSNIPVRPAGLFPDTLCIMNVVGPNIPEPNRQTAGPSSRRVAAVQVRDVRPKVTGWFVFVSRC